MTTNPYPDPTAGKSGNVLEILESLTDGELETYIDHLFWERDHRVFSTTNVYQSRAYYEYRSGNWIGTCQQILAHRRKKRKKKATPKSPA
ncbi:MAG: hypothetical protein ACKOYL_12515 [Actinomycetota bacterium]